jgi:hypothetical protein
MDKLLNKSSGGPINITSRIYEGGDDKDLSRQNSASKHAKKVSSKQFISSRQNSSNFPLNS